MVVKVSVVVLAHCFEVVLDGCLVDNQKIPITFYGNLSF